MASEPILASLSLGGDGDEVDAIEEVERRLDVKLDHGDAGTWVTAGDVYASVLAALPAERRDEDDLWTRFAEAIAEETGVDPTRVGPATLVIAPRPWHWHRFEIKATIIASLTVLAMLVLRR